MALVALAAAVIAGIVIVTSSGPADSHTLRASFASTINLVEGHPVRLAGQKVGRVQSIRLDAGRAVVTFSIDDGRAWPLSYGTRARIRFGATTAYADRYVELQPGRSSASPLPDGGVIPPDDVRDPVEFDQMSRILSSRTRPRVRALIGDSADALDGHARNLGPGIASAADALDETSSFVRELGADRAALHTLVTAGARTSRAIASEDKALRGVVTNAAKTFDEFAEHAQATRASFDRLPTTLRVTRAGLARLDPSLVKLGALVEDIRPGARSLVRLAPVVSRVLETLRDVSPLAESALRRARLSSPQIRTFLRSGSPFFKRLGETGEGLGVIFSCIRPYAPELVGFLGTWPGWYKNYDDRGHFARTLVNATPINNGTPQSSAEAVANNPGLKYAFPRPPGLNADQPWFIPECGVGPEALDPNKDPEAPSRQGAP